MRHFTRWAFGLSSAYHGVMGALALVAPSLAILFNGGGAVEAGDPYLRALYRGMGGFMVFASAVLGLVAKDPDGSPLLLLCGGFLSAITLGTWALAAGAGDVTFAQVSSDVLVQLLVLVAAALYYPHARRRTLDVLELLMTGELRDALRRERLGPGAAREVPAGDRAPEPVPARSDAP